MLQTCKAMLPVRFGALHISKTTIFIGEAPLSIISIALGIGETLELAGKETFLVRSISWQGMKAVVPIG